MVLVLTPSVLRPLGCRPRCSVAVYDLEEDEVEVLGESEDEITCVAASGDGKWAVAVWTPGLRPALIARLILTRAERT